MSTLERQAIEAAFRNWKLARMPDADESDAFEVFSAELVLKDFDLSDSEIQSGISGGGGDGGVDGFYFFVDRVLIQSGSPNPKAVQSVQLNLIQATTSPGFNEGKIDKLDKFCRYLLDWEDLSGKNLRQSVRDQMLGFREKYAEIFSGSHSLSVNLYYVSKSEHPPSDGVMKRVEELKTYIKGKLTLAEVEFHPWGCKRLLAVHQKNPEKKLTLQKVKELIAPDSSVVCLCKVADYAKFLDDGSGNIRTWMMEPNVRDYQGNNKVNKQIRETLNSAIWTEDFWWLNNGVTILADDCSLTGNVVRIDNPEVVNGLQTSYEVFKARANPTLAQRHLLVKIIVAREDKSKTAIIKATNSQTTVNSLSLKATEPLQFAIEDELLGAGLFYDRRKGKYRQLNKPIKNIVSIGALGQAVISAYLQQPSDARARPETVLNEEKSALLIFNEGYDLKFYRACILIDRRCEQFVRASTLGDDEKTDLRYYVTMIVTCELCGKANPQIDDIVNALPNIGPALTDALLAESLKLAQLHYQKFGATDKAAKGRDMEDSVKQDLASKFLLS